MSNAAANDPIDLRARLQALLGDAFRVESELGGGGMSRVFVATGALHLPGESGLIALLRAEGFELEPLPSPFAAALRPSGKDAE